MKLNSNYDNLKQNYLFATIEQKVSEFKANHPDRELIYMGIGDVTLPLSKSVTEATHAAADEMATSAGFRGYGPYRGYGFLLDAIADYYAKRGVELSHEEIFVGDGAKTDTACFSDIFSRDNVVAVADPVYPVYYDSNVMDGREVTLIAATRENGFLPMPSADLKADVIYLCSPSNPTGAVYTKEQLKAWVDFANANDALILFDAAYEAYITDPALPHTIFEVEGARTCAVEFCSFSKNAGFTGTRASYVIIPKELERDGKNIGKVWLRRQSTKFNGTPYIIQRAAAAVFSDEGQKEVREMVGYYMENARMLVEAFEEFGVFYTGGVNSPYIWFEAPKGKTSWEFFDLLLNEVGIVSTPGAGFGVNGEGFLRLTAFNTHENTAKAVELLKKVL
ncbi:MAG: LL-diaminopimelate aminotransferase [Clostridia bacterium]|nr:LL-diaminopimelate aminotransferase [Clostridia bacterium]